ncbi:MAG TPA: pentapeptide repeat-containing protein [Candidatus Lustribacter sp.]|nr:pentapeptide repeat-containing protein [Candidatus Lustribacter sp.]
MLEPDADLDGETLTGSWVGARAERATLHECRVEDGDLTGLRAAHSRWIGCTWTRVHGTDLDLSGSVWSEFTITDARLGAVALYGAQLRSGLVSGGKVDFLNLRGAALADVSFEGAVLTEPDFAEARLTRVSFEGCRLVAPDFSRVVAKDLDLTGARIEAPVGLASLRGATVSRLQLFDFAADLAAQLGIRVVG